MSEKEKIDFVLWSQIAVAQILDNQNISHRKLLAKLHAIEFDKKSLQNLAANKSVEHFISLLLVVETLKAEIANERTVSADQHAILRKNYEQMCEGYETRIKKLKIKKAK